MFNCKGRLEFHKEMKLTSLARSQDSGAKSINAINEAVMVVAHCVARQETSIAQRRKLLLPMVSFDYVSAHQVPVIQSLLEGIFIMTQNLLCFLLKVRVTKIK